MINIISGIFIVVGSVFALIAALGILRMPDLLMRMHAGTKAGTLSIALILIATAIDFGTVSAVTRAIIAIIFLFITIPISAHILGRAAYFVNVPLWDRTVIDELRDHYNQQTHELNS